VVSSVDPKALVPVGGVARTPQVRPRSDVAQTGDSTSTDRSAQTFLERLPSDVRERIGQTAQEGHRRTHYNRGDLDNDNSSARIDAEDSRKESTSSLRSDYQSSYSAPLHTSNLALLQAQLEIDEEADNANVMMHSAQHETYHNAYVNAGAQPGGESAALEATSRREELENKTLIVPPVLTTVNFIA